VQDDQLGECAAAGPSSPAAPAAGWGVWDDCGVRGRGTRRARFASCGPADLIGWAATGKNPRSPHVGPPVGASPPPMLRANAACSGGGAYGDRSRAACFLVASDGVSDWGWEETGSSRGGGSVVEYYCNSCRIPELANFPVCTGRHAGRAAGGLRHLLWASGGGITACPGRVWLAGSALTVPRGGIWTLPNAPVASDRLTHPHPQRTHPALSALASPSVSVIGACPSIPICARVAVPPSRPNAV